MTLRRSPAPAIRSTLIMSYNLERFLEAQDPVYTEVLHELREHQRAMSVLFDVLERVQHFAMLR